MVAKKINKEKYLINTKLIYNGKKIPVKVEREAIISYGFVEFIGYLDGIMIKIRFFSDFTFSTHAILTGIAVTKAEKKEVDKFFDEYEEIDNDTDYKNLINEKLLPSVMRLFGRMTDGKNKSFKGSGKKGDYRDHYIIIDDKNQIKKWW